MAIEMGKARPDPALYRLHSPAEVMAGVSLRPGVDEVLATREVIPWKWRGGGVSRYTEAGVDMTAERLPALVFRGHGKWFIQGTSGSGYIRVSVRWVGGAGGSGLGPDTPSPFRLQRPALHPGLPPEHLRRRAG